MSEFAKSRALRRGTILGAVIVAIVMAPTAAWADGQLVWSHTYNSGAPEGTTAVAVTTDPGNGNVYVLARDDCCPFATYDTVAYSSSGSRLWHAASSTAEDLPAGIAVDPATHDVIVTGSRNRDRHNLYTINYSDTGTVLWSRNLTSSAGRAVSAAGIVLDGAGRVIVAGMSSLSGEGDYLTVAYRISTGKLLWHVRYAGPVGDDEAVAIAADPSRHSVFVTGTSMGTNFPELTTVAYAAATGVQQWVARDTGNFDVALGLAVDPTNHHVYAVSGSEGGHMAVYAYSANGSELWNSGDESPNAVPGYPRAGVTVDPSNGQVYVAGDDEVSGGQVKTDLAAYSADGTLIWVHTLHSGPEDLALDVTADATNHRVYVAGERAHAGGGFQMATYAETSSGTSAWTATHASPVAGGEAEPVMTAIDAARKRVYIAGYEQAASTVVLETLAYKA